MKNSKLSIIVAAYNEEKNLKNFFNFWLNQDYNNYEILIVNDGSKDTTEEVVMSYIHNYGDKIRLINNDKNRGVGYTRYNGFIHANGDVIKFSDADIAPDYPPQRDLITRLMKPFNENPKVDIGYIDYYPFFDKKNIVRSIENFYYVSPVLKTPKNFKTIKTLTWHMPTLFRKKNINLEWVFSIKNWEDRFIALQFLKNSWENAKAEGVYLFDWQIISIFPWLYKRYSAYGKNGLWLLKISRKLFLFHILKPSIVVWCLLFWFASLIGMKSMLALPLVILYFWFFWLTLRYLLNYKKESKILLFQIALFWPFFLMLRYVFVFIWLLKMR